MCLLNSTWHQCNCILQTRRAELKIAVMLANLPLTVTDHLGPLMKECFKDSATAQEYKCPRTKTACIINQAVAAHFKNALVMLMRENPYTLITDGSNDTGRKEMHLHHGIHWVIAIFLKNVSCLYYVCLAFPKIMSKLFCQSRKRKDEPPYCACV